MTTTNHFYGNLLFIFYKGDTANNIVLLIFVEEKKR